MIFILGIICGILLSIVLFIAGLWIKPKAERRINIVTSALKEKGQILEAPSPDVEQLNQWLEQLPTTE